MAATAAAPTPAALLRPNLARLMQRHEFSAAASRACASGASFTSDVATFSSNPFKTTTHRRGSNSSKQSSSSHRRSPGGVKTVALVNLDFGPAAILGASVMVSAIGLYQVRASRPEVSRDQDVFFSSVGLLCGGILVFQGWRLDPLMLFGQLLTVGRVGYHFIFTLRYSAVKTPIDDSRYGPCNQSDTGE
jgi:hypothetical protein